MQHIPSTSIKKNKNWYLIKCSKSKFQPKKHYNTEINFKSMKNVKILKIQKINAY